MSLSRSRWKKRKGDTKGCTPFVRGLLEDTLKQEELSFPTRVVHSIVVGDTPFPDSISGNRSFFVCGSLLEKEFSDQLFRILHDKVTSFNFD